FNVFFFNVFFFFLQRISQLASLQLPSFLSQFLESSPLDPAFLPQSVSSALSSAFTHFDSSTFSSSLLSPGDASCSSATLLLLLYSNSSSSSSSSSLLSVDDEIPSALALAFVGDSRAVLSKENG